MINKNFDKYANKIVNAFLKNKIISPIPSIYTKKISNAQKFRKHCESKIFKPTFYYLFYCQKGHTFNQRSKIIKKFIFNALKRKWSYDFPQYF